MRPDDMIMVSVDDHLVEPPDLFDNHIPDKWRDRAPTARQRIPGGSLCAGPGPGRMRT